MKLCNFNLFLGQNCFVIFNASSCFANCKVETINLNSGVISEWNNIKSEACNSGSLKKFSKKYVKFGEELVLFLIKLL